MLERRHQELDLVRKAFGEISVGQNLEWVIIHNYTLPSGWNKSQTALLIIIRPGYPTTPPDNFYTDGDLRLSNNTQPGNTSQFQYLDKQWLQFSYHAEVWQPHPDLLLGHNLFSLLHAIQQRLKELN